MEEGLTLTEREITKSKEQQTVIEIDRSKYDDSIEFENEYIAPPGLNEEVIVKISKSKNEPEWMLQKRLLGYKIFKEKPVPDWGPDLSHLDLDNIIYYVSPKLKQATKWEDVPEEIRKTAERIGIPEAERNSLGGAGFQFDSKMAYHKLQEELEQQGVVFENMDDALHKYPELVKKYFMTSCISPALHKFAALHAAVWSGGTFIYVPEGVKVRIPLQAYFRMNALKGGQFEHTLIIVEKNAEIHYIEGCSSPVYEKDSLHAGCVEVFVNEGARARYTSIENWSRNTYNLNTKRAIVQKNAIMEWVNGNMGSNITMLYPCSVLVGENAKTDYIGIAYAGKGQHQDTGCKVYHLAPNTSSNILSKGICKNGGIASYRGLVEIKKGAKNSTAHVCCDGLMLDNESRAITYPSMIVNENDVKVAHEAAVGKIGEEQLFYLMSRGLSESEATKMIVSGYIEPIIKELPLEYAVELNKLIELEIENSVS